MRWLADECVNAALVARLREAGHDVSYIMEIAPRATDAEVITRARDENRLLLTEDKDFGDLVFLRNRQVPGNVLLRIDPARHAFKWRRSDHAARRKPVWPLHGRGRIPLPFAAAAIVTARALAPPSNSLRFRYLTPPALTTGPV